MIITLFFNDNYVILKCLVTYFPMLPIDDTRVPIGPINIKIIVPLDVTE